MLLFPVAIALSPPVGRDYNTSMHAVQAYYDKWDQVVIKVLGACFLISFFAKGRLILAAAVASIGVGCFWIAKESARQRGSGDLVVRNCRRDAGATQKS